jgi:hypothetical protein
MEAAFEPPRRLTHRDVEILVSILTGAPPDEEVVAGLYARTGGAPRAVLREIEALLAGEAHPRDRVCPPAAPAHPWRVVFRREADYWTVARDGAVFRLHDLRGLHYLASLLRQPSVWIDGAEQVQERGSGPRRLFDPERARQSITKAIRSAIGRVAALDPALGQHLSTAVRRGYRCVYLPEPGSEIEWDLG